MRKIGKWSLICAAVAVAVLEGCGGAHSSASSGSGSGGNNNSGGGRANYATVNLPNKGTGVAFVDFLGGAGRDLGDLYMYLQDCFITDTPHNVTYQRNSQSLLSLDLDQYQIQFATIDVNTSNLNSESFDTFNFLPAYFAIEQPGGIVPNQPGEVGYLASDPSIPSTQVPTRLTVFPGRDSILPIFLTSAMFMQGTNGATGQQTESLNLANFEAINEPTTSDPNTSGKAVAMISDYVQFDLSGLSATGEAVPTLQDGNPATHFYFSGDDYAQSDDVPNGAGDTVTNGIFEELTFDPANPIEGLLAPPGQLPNTGSSTPFPPSNFPGTYNLQEANPQGLTGQGKPITSLYGRWRNIKDVIVMTQSTFDIIIFPNSAEAYTENSPADCVAITHSGNTITGLYAGYAFFTPNTGDTPTARLYPIQYFANPMTFPPPIEYDYTLSNFVDANGNPTTFEPSIRTGKFTAVSSGLPTGFAQTGTFVVFR
jgi:hypothetical protein